MKFSIVTPSFNQGKFIRDCIESVAGQQGADFEHIVIDACSTDETLAILKCYPHLQWVSEPDRGQTDAINKGFRLATGDWLMWLNADDYLLPHALERVRQFIACQPTADVVYGDCQFVREDKTVLRHKREFDFDRDMLLFYGCYIPSTATFCHRRIVEAGHRLDLSYRVCMDFEYYLRLAQAGYQFAHLPEELACFRWHSTNVSTTQSTRRYAERLRTQRHYLQLQGRSYLSVKWILRLLFRWYQIKRWVWRCCR